MSRKEKLTYNTLIESLPDYMCDNNMGDFDFSFKFYAYYEDGIEREYSRLVIEYPSVKSYYPGFESALEKLKTHVSDLLISSFDYPIRVETESCDSFEDTVKARFSQFLGNEIVPIITDGSYIALRAEQYERFKDQLGGLLAGTRFRSLDRDSIFSYDVRDDLLPLKIERGSDDWDYVDTELYRLGLFYYANIPILNDRLRQDILDVLSALPSWVEKKGSNVVDITGFDAELSEIIREEIKQAPDNENSTIVLPLTGLTKLVVEVYTNEIITRDDNGDYYNVLLFEGKEIFLVTEEKYDFMLWVMSARANFLNIVMKHRDFFNDKLRTKGLEWVLEFVRVNDSLGLSEREQLLIDSLEHLEKRLGPSWGWVSFLEGEKIDIYNSMVSTFNAFFRDRFKVLDSRVGRFDS